MMARASQFKRLYCLKWLAILNLCVIFTTTKAELSLYINRRFAIDYMGLDIEHDITLIKNGRRNQNLTLFDETTHALPSTLDRIELTWLAHKHDVKYDLRVTSGNQQILKAKVENVPMKGIVSRDLKTFEVIFKCSSTGEVKVYFSLNYTHFIDTSQESFELFHLVMPKICHVNTNSTSSAKSVNRIAILTVSTGLALLISGVIASACVYLLLKRSRNDFSRIEEPREHISPPIESNTSSSVSIQTSSKTPTVVYSPKKTSSGQLFTTLTKQESLRRITTPKPACCSSNDRRGEHVHLVSCNAQPSGLNWEFNFSNASEKTALLRQEHHDSSKPIKEESDKLLALETLNEYWSEELGDSIKSSDVVEIRSEVLGEGTFGRVVRGKLIVSCEPSENNVDLAVKICKNEIEFDRMVSFVNEAIRMKCLRHKNILDLIGVVLKPRSSPLVLTPYMQHGSLHQFLRHSRGIGVRRQLISSRQLINFSCQIAKGMEYLASQKIVHRDLTARNCLVDKDLNIKIGSLSLAREVNHFVLFKMEHWTELSVKWLALESLLYYIFNEKSDVWSFGIVLWELVTLGAQPYAGLDNNEVLPYLENGTRLPRPLRCPDDLYTIMQSCWYSLPEERPSFSVLVHKLDDYELRLRPSCITFEFDEDTIEMCDGLV